MIVGSASGSEPPAVYVVAPIDWCASTRPVGATESSTRTRKSSHEWDSANRQRNNRGGCTYEGANQHLS